MCDNWPRSTLYYVPSTYYVPYIMYLSTYLYEDAEFIVRAEGEVNCIQV